MPFDLFPQGGLMQPQQAPQQAMQQPMGGGLIPIPAPPVNQGPGLLPLIVGALGTIAGGGQFGRGYLGGLGARQQQGGLDYRNQLAYYNALQQQQAAQQQAQQADVARQDAAAQQQRIYNLAKSQGRSEEEAIAMSTTPGMQTQAFEQMYAPAPKPVGPAGFQAWLQTNPNGTYEQYAEWQARINPRGVNVQLPQIISGPGGAKFVVHPDPGAPGGVKTVEVVKGTPPKPTLTPEQKMAQERQMAEMRAGVSQKAAIEKEQRAEQSRVNDALRALDAYEETISSLPARSIFLPEAITAPVSEAEKKPKKDALSEALALVRTKGLSKTDPDIERALEIIPDTTGWMDAPVARAALQSLRETLPTTPGGGVGAPAVPAGAADTRTESDLFKQYGGAP